ncbi:MAG: SprT family zinc-dependent metalloprotease [Lachnospiraceae bacterium]|nr:SprT family zinc-dependent metalloprotease [Lachnospiraceae bacterium]
MRYNVGMKNLEILVKNCYDELGKAGIRTGDITNWRINDRARTRWGQCRRNPDGTFEIEIAKVLLVDERISEKACKETILHEMLHTCPGCMKHTGKWKQYADYLNASYGYHIKRVTLGKEKGIENYVAKRQPVKYLFTCEVCGAIIRRKRESKFTRNYRQYRCGRCGGRFCRSSVSEDRQ